MYSAGPCLHETVPECIGIRVICSDGKPSAPARGGVLHEEIAVMDIGSIALCVGLSS